MIVRLGYKTATSAASRQGRHAQDQWLHIVAHIVELPLHLFNRRSVSGAITSWPPLTKGANCMRIYPPRPSPNRKPPNLIRTPHAYKILVRNNPHACHQNLARLIILMDQPSRFSHELFSGPFLLFLCGVNDILIDRLFSALCSKNNAKHIVQQHSLAYCTYDL